MAISDADHARFLTVADKYRHPDGSYNTTQIAAATGETRSVIQRRLKKLEKPVAKFDRIELPTSELPLQELLARRVEESDRALRADAARDLIPVAVNIDGPFGLFVFGDPHVDDPGCNFRLLKQHVDMIKGHPHIVAGHIGDLANFWVGRLMKLYADQATTAHEAWRLVEWLLNEVPSMFLALGNHDLWNGAGNPIEWIMRTSLGVTEPHGVRLALTQPCGTITRVHARHNFKGTSIYNELHGLKREVMMGLRDHVVIAGHHHVGGDAGTVAPDGLVSQIVRVAGYKEADHYAKELGLKSAKIHPSALIIIDPSRPDTCRGRAFCAPTIEQGIIMLDALRRDYEATK
jgi:hypothetical protein